MIVTYKVLKLGDLLLQDVGSNFVVFNHAVDLQLLDAVADWQQFGCSPQKPVHLHRAHTLLQLRHICLIIPLREHRQLLKAIKTQFNTAAKLVYMFDIGYNDTANCYLQA